MRRCLLLAAGLLLIASRGSSQIVGPAVFTPTNATETDVVRAEFIGPGLCGIDSSTTVSGTVVRTTVTVGGCVLGPPAYQVTAYAFFGPLPQGTYTYELYVVDVDAGTPARLVSSQRLVVAASIPTLSPAILIGLVVGLAAIAWFALSE